MKRRWYGWALALVTALAFAPLGRIGVDGMQVLKTEENIALTIDMDVGEETCNGASFHVGEYHIWIVQTTVPADIADAKSYEVRNTIDNRLTLETDSVRVMLCSAMNEMVDLKQNVHYLLSDTYEHGKEQEYREIIVTLTREGMAFAGKASGFTESRLKIMFRAAINSGVGESIPNMAAVRYTDLAGKVFSAESDKPEVHSGGIVLRKTDAAGNPLAGAEFRIARPTEALGTDMLMLEEEVVPVEYQSFHSTRDLSGGKVSSVVTDENGIAVLYGLAYGSYFIVETKAPDGYNLLTQPIAVIIDAESHLTAADGWQDAEGRTVDNTIRVVNTKFVLPDTGGWGTEIYIISGGWIMIAALILLLMNIRWRRTG